MQGLASFAMRGRAQALAAAGALGVLGLVLPAVGILSAAVVALVTLRQGPQEGLMAAAGAAAITAVVSYLLFGSSLPVLGLLLLSWLPVWAVATLLRLSRSLVMGLLGAAGVGLVAILVVYAQSGAPQALWTELLEPIRLALVDSQGIDETLSRQIVEQIAVWMTGAFAAGLLLQLAATLILARWWQAVLYNPGGFGQEFHQLRFPALLGYVTLGLFALSVVGGGEFGWARDLLLILASLFLLQGLAVLHSVAARTGANRAWLVVLYLLLFFVMPHAILVVSGVGLADTWANLRARFPLTKRGG